MDGIVFNVRENSKVDNPTIYIAVGIRRDGKKEVLGLWLGKNESTAFWMSFFTDMKARGVEDMLIRATITSKVLPRPSKMYSLHPQLRSV